MKEFLVGLATVTLGVTIGMIVADQVKKMLTKP